MTPPRLIKEVKPQYTVEAMTAKVQGTVLVECVIEIDGTVRRARVARSLDARFGLDQSALDAVKGWQFEPGTRDGKPVPVLVTIELSFVLRSDPAEKAPLALPEAFGGASGRAGLDDSAWEDDTVRASPLTVGLHHPKGWRVMLGEPGFLFIAQAADAPVWVLMVPPAPTTAKVIEPGTKAELQKAGEVVASGFKRQVSAVGRARVAERMWLWFDLGVADLPDGTAAGQLGATRVWVFSTAVDEQQVILAFTIGHPKGTAPGASDAEALRVGPIFSKLLERLSFTRSQ